MSETKNDNSHLMKALHDEPLFVLMTRDSASPRVIAEWIKESLLTQPIEKLHSALDLAVKMANENERVRLEVEKKKREDRNFKLDEEV